jgi:hypothetical protein
MMTSAKKKDLVMCYYTPDIHSGTHRMFHNNFGIFGVPHTVCREIRPQSVFWHVTLLLNDVTTNQRNYNTTVELHYKSLKSVLLY